MSNTVSVAIEIIGVHPINAPEPCHLIELVFRDFKNDFDWGSVTQEVLDQPRANWQVAYDEQVLEETENQIRYVFFFHYLDFSQPLLTPLGALKLPEETTLPPYLREVEYYPP